MKLEEMRNELENLIAARGVGSSQLAKVERLQRDVNLAIALAGTAIVIGIMAYSVSKFKDSE